MSIFFGLLFARRFYCRSALSFSPGITGGFLPRINAPKNRTEANCFCPVIFKKYFKYCFSRCCGRKE